VNGAQHFKQSVGAFGVYVELVFAVPVKMESAAVLSATCPSWREIYPTKPNIEFGHINKSRFVRHGNFSATLRQSLRRKPNYWDVEGVRHSGRGELNFVLMWSISDRPVLQSPTLGKPIKLEMEEFSDLGPFLPESAPKATSNFIDELNTPIFGEFGANKTRIGGNKGFI
jgi:hypothetical protein